MKQSNKVTRVLSIFSRFGFSFLTFYVPPSRTTRPGATRNENIQKDTTEEIRTKIKQKQQVYDAMSRKKKSFPLSLHSRNDARFVIGVLIHDILYTAVG